MSFFNVLYKVKNYFYSSSHEQEQKDYSERFYAGGNDDVQKDIKQSSIKGIITFIDTNKTGRIDGYINFDRSTVVTFKCKEKKINIGAEVSMEIVRNSKTSPWYASSMEILSCPTLDGGEDWDEPGNEKVSKIVGNNEKPPEKQVGMITSAYNGELILNNEIKFHQDQCGATSFRPMKGDWVIVKYNHSIEAYRVVGVLPLRYVDFEGCISSIEGNIGYVDREILFNRSIIKEQIRRGTTVYGTAIESVQGRRCNFRALTIFVKHHRSELNNRGGLLMRLKTIDKRENGIKNPHSVGLHLNVTVLDFGQQSINDTVTKEITITNNNPDSIVIESAQLSSETNNQFVIEGDDNVDRWKNLRLESGKVERIAIKCRPQFPGLDTQYLLLTSGGWKIMVDLSVYVFDPVADAITMKSEAGSNAGSDMGQNIGDGKGDDFVSGIHLSAAAPVKLRSILTKVYPHKLKMYPVPVQLEVAVENGGTEIGALYPVIGKLPMNPGNYAAKMDLLVHLEEINTKREMKQFVLENVRLMKRRETFAIEVPGLSEGRPSLMVGDKVDVRVHQSGTFSGSIEDIMCDCIFVRFHASLHGSYTNEECTVSFSHSRLPFRRMHLGIEVACGTLGDAIIFPGGTIKRKPSQVVRLSRAGGAELPAGTFTVLPHTNSDGSDNTTGVDAGGDVKVGPKTGPKGGALRLQFYNTTLNELQRVAVVRIVHGYSRPLPYVLFGPPGTGKTVTLVEAILQVYKNVVTSRIVLCAPSNSAADLLCLRLHESGALATGEMVRMNAYRRTILSEISDKEPIPASVLPYCKSIDELAEIAMHRIIICTCISSGALYRLGLKSGHISHVFVDEAGQASEPEIMVSLGLISPDNGQIVLAGDPMQLGPVIRSPYAQQLQESYLHRLLLSCDLYRKQREICAGSSTYYNPILVTQLLNNYRAHPTLLKLPSEMFYDGTLIPCADKTRFVNWKWLPNPEVPFIFHGVRGKELRNQRNPSTYNPSEAVLVVRWIGRLLQDVDGIGKLEDANISVITPYRAQVDCIRKLIKNCLEDVNLAKLKVASVEEFQGQENEVIIISTVRSSLDDNAISGAQESLAIVNTVSSRLGFLANKRRFNVSITRACSLLIVIGDPALLQYDECWNGLIKYAKNTGAYMGSDS